jgi:hypothetical protein
MANGAIIATQCLHPQLLHPWGWLWSFLLPRLRLYVLIFITPSVMWTQYHVSGFGSISCCFSLLRTFALCFRWIISRSVWMWMWIFLWHCVSRDKTWWAPKLVRVKTFPEEGQTSMEREIQENKEHRRQTEKLNFDQVWWNSAGEPSPRFIPGGLLL